MSYPFCAECGTERSVQKAVVTRDDETHDVIRAELDCGHVLDDPNVEIEPAVVQLLKQQRPETIEMIGGAGDVFEGPA